MNSLSQGARCTVVKSPSTYDLKEKTSIFLAGTIDNGDSEDWQLSIEQALAPYDVVVLNPRREQWDHTWVQSISNPQFKQQVEWELEGMERADIVFMYFAPGSQSPITLLELGLMAASGKLIVVAPDGFWRKGNIEVVATRFGVAIFKDIDAGLRALEFLLYRSVL